ncbi:hypothetical protein Pme01_08810 [Planosporangium mesophilum]|uniref:Uncharacterized protein n=2 Tax=Planosporangium mesophilum TaxID=689768 RepID=A0A8J3TAH7_9ACTN|nr:DUF6758 family protein [Planosporangium mesophilum]NJC81072.1 hypothetical protein [Planosporangium mesophilum]GII21284.1 hypothetical protein Pme01_08810 [Planosporangium mesophilum]
MNSSWRCDVDGPVLPLHVTEHINAQILESVVAKVATGSASGAPTPLWGLWPLPTGWMVTGVGWAGDCRSGVRATVLACSGPAPIDRGPADIVLVAEEPGVGLGARFAGIPGPDPGPFLEGARDGAPAHAKVRAAGWPTPLWSVKSADDRSAYVGEARGMWLYAVAWPSSSGYLVAEDLSLCDLVESRPSELVFGAPSPYLHGSA